MNYTIKDNKIEIFDADTFEPESVLASGQIFRFGCVNDVWWVCSGENRAEIKKLGENHYLIDTNNAKFFENYFDFSTNYDIILTRLGKHKVLQPALEYSRGVRLLRQPLLEVIINFIISANNNIPRIRKSVQGICEQFGTKTEWGFAFPALEQLSKATIQDFTNLGCGYRAPYLVDTIAKLQDEKILKSLLTAKDTQTAREILLSLKGVGPKVADCILLFGLQRFDVFPVDTWIHKVYVQNFNGQETNRNKITKWFVDTFGADSGYCQQYLFYYKRKDISLK
ncbi:MAG: DNA-3-methyladenine glycosylase 2 family protein [Clostridia bacterium]|nr:DNA-3-methyladenine glycosylase 2 family protein [Clostridia bacterium]